MEERPERHRPPPPGPYPWLVYPHGKDQTFCTILDPNKTQFRKIPELSNKNFWTSCHGWCILSNQDDHCFSLWNPLTLEEIKLPPFKSKRYVSYCTLSSSPKNPTCMVLLFECRRPSIIYCQPGDAQWTVVEYEKELKRCLQTNHETDDDNKETLDNPFIYNGNIYALTCKKKEERILQIHIIKQNRISIKSLCYFPYSQPHAGFYQWRLVEYCGKVYWIRIMLAGIGDKEVVAVDVYASDFGRWCWRWNKLESAKDLAFFVGDKCSVCCPAMKPDIEGNHVYFILDEGKNVYSYNIEDGTLSVSQPFRNLPTRRSKPFWLMIDHRLTSRQVDAKLRIVKEEEGLQVGGERNEKDVVEEEDAKGSHFSFLPSEIVPLIAKRLILVDYLHFRATCRTFCSVAPPIQWKKAFNGLERHSLSPWLMFFEKVSLVRVCTFFDPVHSEKYLIKLPHSLSGCVICYSKNGWFLMSKRFDYPYFFNPFTREIKRIPYFNLDTKCIGVSSSPTSLDCKVVEIRKCDCKVYMNFAYLRGERWESFDFDDDTDFCFNNNSPVFYNGAFYYLGQDGNLGVLELMDDDEFNWKVLPKPEQPCNSYNQNFLVECDGELLSVFVGHFGKWVQIFRLDRSIMTWMKVESLGNNMIFVSRSSSFSTKAKTPGVENKIYFPRFHGQSIVFYSLDTEKYHTFESKDSPVDFYGTREQLHCGWIEPMWC